jgi:hypothetical protein
VTTVSSASSTGADNCHTRPLPSQLKDGLFRIQIFTKSSNLTQHPTCGPLQDGMTVSGRVLSRLVRQTAINLNRLIRNNLISAEKNKIVQNRRKFITEIISNKNNYINVNYQSNFNTSSSTATGSVNSTNMMNDYETASNSNSVISPHGGSIVVSPNNNNNVGAVIAMNKPLSVYPVNDNTKLTSTRGSTNVGSSSMTVSKSALDSSNHSNTGMTSTSSTNASNMSSAAASVATSSNATLMKSWNIIQSLFPQLDE